MDRLNNQNTDNARKSRSPLPFKNKAFVLGGGSDPDKPVKDTFQDALSSRWSAAQKGYLKDPYVGYFGPFENKPPLINRGTYIRTQAVDDVVYKFLSYNIMRGKESQILSFGAGMDTRFFNLLDDASVDMNFVTYFEIDFPEIVELKSKIIFKNNELKSKLFQPEYDYSSCILKSRKFNIFGGDLRSFTESILPRLLELGFEPSVPTLYIAECVFVYIEPESVDHILKWISINSEFAVIVSYEQVLSDSSFGKTMISNLKMRGLRLQGLKKYPDIKAQKVRYFNQGWNLAENRTIWEIETRSLPSSELSRINRIEQLDEIEEWKLLASHYSVLVALKHNQFDQHISDEFNQLLDFTCHKFDSL